MSGRNKDGSFPPISIHGGEACDTEETAGIIAGVFFTIFMDLLI
jgi:hypothetical protein